MEARRDGGGVVAPGEAIVIEDSAAALNTTEDIMVIDDPVTVLHISENGAMEDYDAGPLDIHGDVISDEHSPAGRNAPKRGNSQSVNAGLKVETARLNAFVKFVQQPDGSLAPVELVQEEDIIDQGSIVTDPMMVETAEEFSRSALTGGQLAVLGGGLPPDGAGPSSTPPARGPGRRRRLDMSKPFPCEICGFRYKTNASLRVHQRIYHSDSVKVKTRDGLRCGEEGCTFTASHSKALRIHLTQAHHIKMDIVKLIFRDWEEFNSWRHDFESETGSHYRQYQRQLSAGQLVKFQLICPGSCPTVYQRRAGWRRRGQAARPGRPPHGPLTTRVTCTSFIRAARAEGGGPVAVTVNTTHYGHTLREPAGNGRLKEPMPEANRLFLEEKLKAGWSLERILREARRAVLDDPAPGNPMFRLHRDQVYKVARRLGIPAEQIRSGGEPAATEFSALRGLAEKLTASEQLHVLFHKDPGDIMEGVHESDYVFAFTTAKQLEQLHTHGANVVMMESTDAPRDRPNRLTSVYVFDGDGDQPQPVAWMLSSSGARELALELVHALHQLSVRVRGQELPAPRYLVADKQSSFHQMWVEATGQRPLRLLDQTRVRAALNTVLIKHVEDAAQRQEVWRAVSRLMSLTGQEEEQEGAPPPPRDELAARRVVYRSAAALTRQLLSRPTTSRFGAYMEEKWLKRGLIEEWQTLFRKGVRVPFRCSAHVYHEAVASEYLTGTERRVDKAVTKLLEFANKWHEPAPEKDAMAPKTMAKFFPHSAGLWRRSGAGSADGGAGPSGAPAARAGHEPPDRPSAEQLSHELRLRLEGLVNRLDAGLGEPALQAWRRSVAEMEEAVSRR